MATTNGIGDFRYRPCKICGVPTQNEECRACELDRTTTYTRARNLQAHPLADADADVAEILAEIERRAAEETKTAQDDI